MKIRSIVNVSCCLALLSMSTGVAAQSELRWHNVDINQQNREPRRAVFFAVHLAVGSQRRLFRKHSGL